MKKKILTILLTALVFLSATALGVSTVFRVDTVAIEISRVSAFATEDAEKLRAELIAQYEQESIFSVEKSAVNAAVEKYPYLRMTGFKKSYPNKLVLTLSEDAEVYAVEKENGEYYILGGDGSVLEIRSTPVNRLDNENNVLLKGLEVSGERGGVLSGDNCWDSMRTLCLEMDKALGGIRSNILSVEVLYRKPETAYRIRMKEGVTLYFWDPAVMTKEKARGAIDKYLSLSDAQRMTGRITVGYAEGEVLLGYEPIDEFE